MDQFNKRRTPRKRCNRCEFLEYAYMKHKKKYGYVCQKSRKQKTYTELTLCNEFKKKK